MSSNSRHLVGETIRTDIAFCAADLNSGKTSEVYLSMADCQKIAGIVLVHLSPGKKVVLQLKQATDSAGTGSKNLGSAVTVTNTGHSRDVIARVETRADSLDADNDFVYVGLNADTDESATGAGIFLRYGNTFHDGIAEVSLSEISVTTTTVTPTTTAGE